jgi:dipicolinate synthase subunit A
VSERGFFSYAVTVNASVKGWATDMNEKMKLAVLGGDRRQLAMAARLVSYGYGVVAWGFGATPLPDAVLGCEHWREAVGQADAVILPLPASADGVRVYCPLQGDDSFLRITALLDAVAGKRLFGGRLSESVRSIADQKGVLWTDYFESELLQLQNAVPTAEGAIEIALHELPITLHGCGAAIIGYGRIGRALADRLAALGAAVTVYARNREQRALAEICRHAAKPLIVCDSKNRPADDFPNTRVIFNTVPGRILTRDILGKIPRNCLLIDLASAPGGIDQVAANELGFRSIWGSSLPGKCAPESAGIIIAETLRAMLEGG